jgi:hypothetical protein
VLAKLPLIGGIILAIVLAGLVVLTWQRPDQVLEALGTDPSPLASSNTIPLPEAHLEHPDSTPNVNLENTEPAEHSGHDHPVISYEGYKTFPLTPMQYIEECWKQNQQPHAHGDYWELPKNGMVPDVPHQNAPGTCTSSITYMFDGRVGLAADLALMAQAAGLAREANRTFFVIDRDWNRGKWLDHFEDVRIGQPGPEPGCKPPPPEELIACPRLAKHWVLHSHTAKFHFGHDFANSFEDAYAREIFRQKPIFERARESLTTTIRPNAKTVALIWKARDLLKKRFPTQDVSDYVAVHIRRGDAPSTSWEYHQQPIPLDEYATAVANTLTKLSLSESTPIYVATDSPNALESFSQLLEQKSVSLWGSGDKELKAIASDKDYVQKEWMSRKDAERRRLTTGAIVDFALMSGLWNDSVDDAMIPRAVVCTISSMLCNLSAMGLGWNSSFIEKNWVEIDNKGNIDPIWEAFALAWKTSV